MIPNLASNKTEKGAESTVLNTALLIETPPYRFGYGVSACFAIHML
jgi:hypothetical protein